MSRQDRAAWVTEARRSHSAKADLAPAPWTAGTFRTVRRL